METPVKPVLRKRLIEGWRQVSRRVTENRARYRHPPPAPRPVEK